MTELTVIAAFVELWASSSLSTPCRAAELQYQVLAVPLKEFTVHTREEMSLYAADMKNRVNGIQNNPSKTNEK